MEKHIQGENGLSYTLGEDGFYYPDLVIPEGQDRPIGRFGRLHLEYIKEHKKAFYMGMLLTCTLNGYLADLDEQAKECFDWFVSRMAEAQGIDEELKATDQMAWVGRMNNMRLLAEEFVLHEMIYK